MFKSFEEINTNQDIKMHISWVEDLFKHLSPLHNENNSNLFNQPEVILHEIGIIIDQKNYSSYQDFFNENIEFIGWEKFKLLLNNISHENGFCILPKLCKKCREEARHKFDSVNQPKLIDLFCGAGGMSLGFNQVGYRTMFANDIDPSCIETYTYNHPEVDPNRIILGDIQELAKTIHNLIDDIKIDVVIGGPPCQGFSNANKQRVINDPRNKLYKEFVEVVQTVQPHFFIMENVIGMKNIAHQVIEDFKNAGYETEYSVLNAADFGIPQNRKRIFFIGNNLGINNKLIFEALSKNHMVKKFTLQDAIEDLPKLNPLRIKNSTKFESEETGKRISFYKIQNPNEYIRDINAKSDPMYLYNHKSRYNNERDIEIFSRLSQGDKSDDPKIADIMPYTRRKNIFKDKYYKLIYNQVSKTITAHMKFDCNMYIHPTQPRGLTPREAARIQSYPDDYFFRGSFTKTYMQIGNSVPPLLARYLAIEVKKYLSH